MRKKYPKADPHLLDHLIALEAFLDKSIVFGFSYGLSKAEIAVMQGKLLGHHLSHGGVKADPERTQAVRDFPPLREKLHIQQFLGCGNWLRAYLPVEYGHAAKILNAYQKPGAIFPEGGLGSANTDGCKAVKAIKRMMTEQIELSIFDEATAITGECPLEGTVLQMSRDRTKMKVLLTHSKSLTPPQQAWPPLIQEAFAQLEVKRASRKVLGTIRAICWTDHANLTRAQGSDIGGDVKLLRWVAEIIADGSEIRSLAGRTAKLGDGFSRNPKGRDELLEQRTLDVRGLSGQLRGFDLDAYLSDEMPEGPVPWAVGDHALPGGREDVAYVGSLHGLVAAKLKILVAVDYENDAEKALQRVCEEFKMPEWTVTVHPCYGAFEDDDGVWAQFDGATGRLQGDRKVKRARVDLLTSAAKLARAIADYGPDFVVGFGQGGIVAGILRWPLVLEVVLQARNLQRKEAQEICLAWARVKAIWAVAPRWWRTKPGVGSGVSSGADQGLCFGAKGHRE